MLEGWLFCGSQCCLPPGRSPRALLQLRLQVKMQHGYHYICSTIFSFAYNQEHLILWSLKNDSFHNQRLLNVFRPMLLHAPHTFVVHQLSLHTNFFYLYIYTHKERERENLLTQVFSVKYTNDIQSHFVAFFLSHFIRKRKCFRRLCQ